MRFLEDLLYRFQDDPVKYGIRVAICLGVFLFFLLVVRNAVASPVAQAKGPGGEIITITDEPCQLTSVVSGLGYRATWKEGEKTYEGCAGVHPA